MKTELWLMTMVLILAIFSLTVLALTADNAEITRQAIETLGDIVN